jgi:predicted MFS family arabinose efflux permease
MNDTKEKLWNAGFIELIAISFLSSLSFSCVHPLISPYAVSFGAKIEAAATAVGIYSISAMCVRPFGGYFTDRFNKKTLLFLSTILLGISFFGYVFCKDISLLMALRIVHGVAFGINSTVNLALATKYIPKSRTGEGLGYYGVGQVVAQIIGPNIGKAVEHFAGYTVLFFGSAIVVFAAAVMFFIIFKYEEPVRGAKANDKSENEIVRILKNLIAPECIFYALIAGLFSMSNGIINSFLFLFGDERGISQIALFFTVNAIFLFVLRVTIGKVLDKTNLLLTVTVSLLTGVISMSMIGFAGSLPIILVAGFIKAIGHVGGQISLQSACVKQVDESRVGVASSTYYIGADIGNGLGPIWGGKVVAAAGYSASFFTMSGIFAAGIVIFVIYELLHKNKIQVVKEA